MPWSGNGKFIRNNGFFTGENTWQLDAGAGVNIEANRHDTHDQDLASGIDACLVADGQKAPTADLPMGGYKHTGAGNGTARNHYATIGQVQDNGISYGVAGGTADAITVTLNPPIASYADGQLIAFRASANNTGAATLNVNGLGAKQLLDNGANTLRPAGVYTNGTFVAQYSAVFNGFLLVNPTSPRYTSVEMTGQFALPYSVDLNAITAVGTLRASAPAIPATYTVIDCPSAGNIAVKLPAAVRGRVLFVLNIGPFTAAIWSDSSGDLINNAVDTAISLAPNKAAQFVCYSNQLWMAL